LFPGDLTLLALSGEGKDRHGASDRAFLTAGSGETGVKKGINMRENDMGELVGRKNSGRMMWA